ncbi:dna-mediated transposase [Trichonephila clavata]|uniref:Dna-mediated transposase n=1 Tax=Trichonephila clavata TaxID=2740835 RepID=A0A8X6L6P9_TRICU|nr:dna-mediated transposase [Trichonephila clavata]
MCLRHRLREKNQVKTDLAWKVCDESLCVGGVRLRNKATESGWAHFKLTKLEILRNLIFSRHSPQRVYDSRPIILLVDTPKSGCGTSNDGNTARAFLRNPEIASSITGIDEILIRKLHVALTTIACGHEIDAQKFKEFCLKTAELYVALYPWYYMPQSHPKVFIHGGLVNDSISPIGQMSEEVIKARNKDSKYFCEHHNRKFNRKQSMEDMIQMLLVSSDPYITSLRKLKERKKNICKKKSLVC